ncbi:hypothetical protein AGMMS49546_17750 [Spirochaetia bacterium]|nr:hypothetical protein AGMMS49546_17750 [Spirochaetia bacterium]
MKKNKFAMLGKVMVIAVLALGLFLAGCSNPAGPENNNPENNNNDNNDNDSSLVTQNLVLKGTYPSRQTHETSEREDGLKMLFKPPAQYAAFESEAVFFPQL